MKLRIISEWKQIEWVPKPDREKDQVRICEYLIEKKRSDLSLLFVVIWSRFLREKLWEHAAKYDFGDDARMIAFMERASSKFAAQWAE